MEASVPILVRQSGKTDEPFSYPDWRKVVKDAIPVLSLCHCTSTRYEV